MILIVSAVAGFFTIALVLVAMEPSRAAPAVAVVVGLVVAVAVNRTPAVLKALRSARPADGDSP